jgi:spore coat protein U-like protein
MRKFLLAAALAAVAAPAWAANSTGTLDVTVNVAASCTVNAATLDFVSYVGAAVSATSNVIVTCTAVPAGGVSMVLDYGKNALASPRVMSDGVGGPGHLLNYDVYEEAGHTTVWPSTGTGPSLVAGPGAIYTTTVYGQLTGGQIVAAGTYNDALTMTITF